jgi:hypothetical protein
MGISEEAWRKDLKKEFLLIKLSDKGLVCMATETDLAEYNGLRREACGALW